MTGLGKLRKEDLCRDGCVSAAFVGADGTVHRIDFTGGWGGGWNGANGFADAEPGDRQIPLKIYVRIVKTHRGQMVASEDIPRVLHQAIEQLKLF